MAKDIYPIIEDWEPYYKTLEGIRRTGVCNMFEAHIVLKECFNDLTEDEAKEILHNWMRNYNELSEKYSW